MRAVKWLSVLLLVLLAGCSADEADIPNIEHEIKTWAQDQAPAGTRVKVDCPDTIEWRTGGDFHCIVTDRQGASLRVTVTMENDAGDVTWTAG